MGFNTACIILNDQLDVIARREGVGQDIARTVLTAERGPNREPHYTPGFAALPSCRSSRLQIVAVGGNAIQLLGHAYLTRNPEFILRELADQMGFRLVRKPKSEDSSHG